mgnify:CR=1 FL=1
MEVEEAVEAFESQAKTPKPKPSKDDGATSLKVELGPSTGTDSVTSAVKSSANMVTGSCLLYTSDAADE